MIQRLQGRQVEGPVSDDRLQSDQHRQIAKGVDDPRAPRLPCQSRQNGALVHEGAHRPDRNQPVPAQNHEVNECQQDQAGRQVPASRTRRGEPGDYQNSEEKTRRTGQLARRSRLGFRRKTSGPRGGWQCLYARGRPEYSGRPPARGLRPARRED